MTLLFIGLIGSVALMVWGFRSWTHEWAGMVGLFAAMFFGGAFVVALSAQLSFPALMARTAQTRSAVERLGCTASEDVLGTALTFNRDLASAKLWRTRWYASPFFSPGVDTATAISVPECR